MLAPGYLAGISDDIVKIYALLEYDIIVDMIKRFSKLKNISDASLWQAKVYTEIGGLKETIKKYLEKYDNFAKKELNDLFDEAIKKAESADLKVLKEAKRSMSESQKQILESIVSKNQNESTEAARLDIKESGINKTVNALSRLTKTISTTASNDFISEVNKAYMQTVTGAFDYKSAIKNSIKNLAQKGIHTVEYTQKGTIIKRSMEGSVRSNVLTGINQTASQITEQNCKNLDCDLVEVSAHIGARPSHAAWQGGVYSLSGLHPDYPSFREFCRPGEPDGIGGVNCRHSYNPYFEGQERHYSNAELDKMNEPSIKYKGKMITQYDAEQNLRAIERNIRKWKLRAGAIEAGEEDASFEKQKLKAWQLKAQEYCKETGIRRDYSREYAGTKTGTQPRGLKPQLEKTGGTGYDTDKTKKQADEFAEKLIQQKTAIEPKVTKDLQSIMKSTGGHLEGLDFRLKGKGSLARKILSDAKKKGGTIEKMAKNINDVLRYTAVYGEKNYTKSYFETQAILEKLGYKTVRVKNTFTDEALYKGINTLVRDTAGNIFELQFHTPQSLDIKEKVLHKLYEEYRSSQDKTRQSELENLMIRISRQISNPKGCNTIL